MRATRTLTQEQYDALIANLDASLTYITCAQEEAEAREATAKAIEEAKSGKTEDAEKLIGAIRRATAREDKAKELRARARTKLDNTAKEAWQTLQR